MSKLNFSPISEAFVLGSEQIKNTQDEIIKLKQLIGESELGKKPSQFNPPNLPPPNSPPNYQRIGPPDAVQANFGPPSANLSANSNSGGLNFLEIIKHPGFDDIVKDYVKIRHPDWVLTGTQSVPVKENFQENFQENFGKRYSSTICTDIKNYILFFIISLIMYMMLSIIIKR